MNPFDLPGPQFLLFYLGLCAAVGFVLVLAKRWLESGDPPRLGEVDPYLVAYLRAGAHEALRVAVLSLLDRGLIEAKGNELRAVPDAVRRVRRPFERNLLQQLADPMPAHGVFESKELCDAFDKELRAKGLLAGSQEFTRRLLFGVAGFGLLWVVAQHKLEIAHARGRHNTGFLTLLLIAAAVMVALITVARRTALGDRVLRDLRVLFARLREGAAVIQAGGGSNELALLAGVFGLGALAGAARAQALVLFPQGSNKASGSCGTSSSSSGGSSCGSSCGGGGCGGGCGGCGG